MERNKIFLYPILILVLYACQNEPYEQGKNLYAFYCASCHMDDGSGLAKLIPSLSDKNFLKNNKERLPCIIKYGLDEPIIINGIAFDEKMEGFIQLTDAEISNITNYVLHKWAPGEAPMLPESISHALAKCPDSAK